jgi:MFS family permease
MATQQTSRDHAEVAAPRVSQRALTIGLCATVVAIAFETLAVATAMPVAARDLAGLRHYAWAFSLFLIGMLFATVVCGRISDRIGPAKPLLVGLVIFLAGLIVAGTAQHLVQLLAGRLVQGLGSGAMSVAIYVCVAMAFSRRQRPKMFTYISTAWVLPSFVGPPAAAWLTQNLSWHWVFFAVVPLVIFGGAMALPSLLRIMRSYQPSDPDAQKPAPLWAAGLLAVAAATLQLAGQRPDWVTVALVIGGLAGLLLALPPLMPPGFLRFPRGISQVIPNAGVARWRLLRR